MKQLVLAAFLVTLAPFSTAEAQSTVTYIPQQQHADPEAWRRNDYYMGNNGGRRNANAGVYNSDRGYNSNGNGYGSRIRNGNARVSPYVGSNTGAVNGTNGRTNSQTNGVTITNIYSVPSNVSNTSGTTTGTTTTGNAVVNTP